MKKNFKNQAIAIMMATTIVACGNKASILNTSCPELTEKAGLFNLMAAKATAEGPMGMSMSAEYEDSVYRMIQLVDVSIVPIEKIRMFYGSNFKDNIIASISSAVGKERDGYKLMVDNRVSYEHVVKNKNTDEVIMSMRLTPDEIAEALEHQITSLDEIKQYVITAQKTLPREMEPGYTMTEIFCMDDVIVIEIVIDENMKNFDEATNIRQWAKVDQAVTLADLTTGLTFHQVASSVPVGIRYHFKGSQGKNELTISFTPNEVVMFNEEMEKIKDQQIK